VATAADRAAKEPTRPAIVTVDHVAHRAYDLYLARGCEHGNDVSDWLRAERELKSRSDAGGAATFQAKGPDES
jgi:hypothetical protein